MHEHYVYVVIVNTRQHLSFDSGNEMYNLYFKRTGTGKEVEV